jgi:hypothetical protein
VDAVTKITYGWLEEPVMQRDLTVGSCFSLAFAVLQRTPPVVSSMPHAALLFHINAGQNLSKTLSRTNSLY